MDLSVIIVSFNTKRLLKDCLGSLFEKTKKIDFEVICVDNASSDGSAEMVENQFPQVKLIKNRQNLGFAKANNQGLKKACGKYILLLNSDTKLVENCLSKMVSFMRKNPKIGIASCQLINPDGSIQATGGFFPTLPRVFFWMFFLDDLPILSSLIKPFHPHPPSFYLRQRWYERQHSQDWVTGAFLMLRREVFEKAGGLDEKFFMYVEEMEFCFRAKKAGWEVYYTPLTKIVHLGGASGTGARAILGEYQGLKYFYKKHGKGWQSFLLLLFLKVGAALRFLIFGIIRKDLERREAYARAFKEI